MIVTPTTTGYYRYTDINAISALKGFIHPNSLTHPDHPLRKPRTLTNGESRLMFSSAQIEYIRYYLKAVGLVDKLIPIPSSNYLLTSASLRNVSPVYYDSATALRNALKNITKNNRKLKGADPQLSNLRNIFERVRAAWAMNTGVWIAVDFEGWEMKNDDITEFGYSLIRFEDGKTVEEEGHWTVKEMASTHNFKYLPDNREHYHFGQSIEKPLKTLTRHVQELIAKCNEPGPLFLVFHDAHGDIKYLKQLKVPEADVATRLLPDVPPTEGIFVIDTADLFSGLEGHSGTRRGLDRMCRLLKMQNLEHMHNGGNDAHWTLAAMRSMASGPPLDLQREERWPSQTEPNLLGGTSVKVKRQAYELDSDYDDMEGVFGPFTGEADPEPEPEPEPEPGQQPS
ncbi:hypothetical protein BS47DRAFT_1376767 [Hydnum rufescens UP504]|uniref:Gfd2/YDR514C-like C-terminal domain-containing protein n=1 Tax=Hydnum rufescens UP504 TaxID=1448309 RepID=A0A9P6DTH8_9AGAM|nr:hypothetical protein BS47DRAFT_1376767 [Hydnum rufescens UP504]